MNPPSRSHSHKLSRAPGFACVCPAPPPHTAAASCNVDPCETCRLEAAFRRGRSEPVDPPPSDAARMLAEKERALDQVWTIHVLSFADPPSPFLLSTAA
eukprot:SAG22_NODE_74_length_22289_cov_65.265119_14_plen_99_part_00